MSFGIYRVAHIILTGLELASQENLERVLSEQGHRVTIGWSAALPAADALFCNGDDPGYSGLVRRIRALQPGLPVVVVTRLPEAEKWLDALEAGAADYCSAPFETRQIGWLLAAVLGHVAPGERNQARADTSNSPVLL
jgi:DNA-binding response OmpR family regulator